MNTDRVNGLVQKIHGLADSDAREAALELVQGVMELHATALERMLDTICNFDNGEPIIGALAGAEVRDRAGFERSGTRRSGDCGGRCDGRG